MYDTQNLKKPPNDRKQSVSFVKGLMSKEAIKEWPRKIQKADKANK